MSTQHRLSKIARASSQLPKLGEELPPSHPSTEALDLLIQRRSVVANAMTDPGPSPEELDEILNAAIRVPDHGKLAPWRFIVFESDARARFGEVLRKAVIQNEPNAGKERLAFEANRFLRAPTVVAVISQLNENPKIPKWEQELSAGAVCQTMLIAANAMGYASQWITEWYAYDKMVAEAIGLQENERVAGFVYLGSTTKPCMERKRPALDKLVTRWNG